MLCLLGVAVGTPWTAAHGQFATACVDFTGSGIADADQPAFLEKLQRIFNAAGVGSANNPGVTFLNAATPNLPRCHVKAGFGKLPEFTLGESKKKERRATIDLAQINDLLEGADAARRCRAWSEVMAHEVGHLLCAQHRCLGSGFKLSRRQGGECTGEPVLMSDGNCIPPESMGLNPSGVPIQRGSDRESRSWMRLGIFNATKEEKVDPDRKCTEGKLVVVEGKTHRGPPDSEARHYQRWDALIDMVYTVTGRTDLFELGWASAQGEFIEVAPDDINPEHLFELDGGDCVELEIRGRPGTRFEGQVFTQRRFSTVELGGLESPASAARMPRLSVPYFSKATVTFDVEGSRLLVVLDSSEWGDQNGFAIAGPEQLEAVPTSSWPTLAVLAALLLAYGWRRSRLGCRG